MVEHIIVGGVAGMVKVWRDARQADDLILLGEEGQFGASIPVRHAVGPDHLWRCAVDTATGPDLRFADTAE